MKYIGILLLITLTSACSVKNTHQGTYTNQKKQINQQLAAERKSQINIIRPDTLLLKYADARVFLNNNQILDISNASTATYVLDPGKHFIHADGGTLDGNSGCGFEFLISKGEVMYIEVAPNAGGVALPILSILTNPITCKYNTTPIDTEKGMQVFADKKANNKT